MYCCHGCVFFMAVHEEGIEGGRYYCLTIISGKSFSPMVLLKRLKLACMQGSRYTLLYDV